MRPDRGAEAASVATQQRHDSGNGVRVQADPFPQPGTFIEPRLLASGRVDARLKALAALKASSLVGCAF
jgi:hypothetical protein